MAQPASLPCLTDAELMGVDKPARYIGGEFGSIRKDPERIALRLCLAFPDTYEVGMSHLGLQILYDLVNKDPRFAAERVFVPLPDMAQLLRARALPLFSLESKKPLHCFDVLGVSLQYELCATSVLELLELGGIPLHAADRDGRHPLVIGGGPLAYHPESLAAFFDAFLIGDGEHLLPTFLAALHDARHRGLDRARQLDLLSEIRGVYVPARFQELYDPAGRYQGLSDQNGGKVRIRRETLPTLERAAYPLAPVVPHLRAVHNRLSLEIMRGCLRGCRFCQAGYIYRPQRERPADEIVAIADASMQNSGYEELSLLSLSSVDYRCILPLIADLKRLAAEPDKVTISIPSSRADKMGAELLGALREVHRSGFTLAPEAGTQRLRDVINKGLSDEELFESCRRIFELGWQSIKLYFMIGLPTETDDDLQGIIETAAKIKALGKRRCGVTVSVSTFVPKPFTPFQWARQMGAEEIRDKQRIIREGLRPAGIEFRYQDGFESVLEGAIARGDRRMAAVIERAHKLGCRLDAWTEHCRTDLWFQAFSECGFEFAQSLEARPLDAALPWDHVDIGIPKAWFEDEWNRAGDGRTTEDCLSRTCSGCGICSETRGNVSFPAPPPAAAAAASPVPERQTPAPGKRNYRQIIRLRYSKVGPFRFLAHLDLMDALFRSLRRAKIPLAASQGFNPKPSAAFGPPLQLGVESDCEFVDLFLYQEMVPEDVLTRLNQQLPEGLSAIAAVPIDRSLASIQASIEAQEFEAEALVPELDLSALVKDWETRSVSRERGRLRSAVPLSAFVSKVTAGVRALRFSLVSGPSVPTLKPLEALHALTGRGLESFQVRKKGAIFS